MSDPQRENLLAILAEYTKEKPIHADNLLVALGISAFEIIEDQTAWEVKKRLSDMARLRREYIQPLRKWAHDTGQTGLVGSGHSGYWLNCTPAQRAQFRYQETGKMGRRISQMRVTQFDANQATIPL